MDHNVNKNTVLLFVTLLHINGIKFIPETINSLYG